MISIVKGHGMPIDRVRNDGTVFRKKLNGIRPAPSGGVTDPFFSSVLLLLHCDQTAGDPLFIDSSSYARTMVTQGGAIQSSSNALFGQSGQFPDQFSAGLDCVYTTNTVDMDLGLGDFTLEWYGYLTLYPDFGSIFNLTNGLTTLFDASYSDNVNQRVECFFDNFSLVGGAASPANSVILNTGQRWAFERWFNGVNYISSLYQDGVRVDVSSVAPAFAYSIPASTHCKVGRPFLNSLSGFEGFFDELRLTAVARFQSAASYTLATAPFPNT